MEGGKRKCIICFGGMKSSLTLEMKRGIREIGKWGKDKPRKPQKIVPDFVHQE